MMGMIFIALKMLFGDRIKFITLVVGLTFSVLLITQQGSIFAGLMYRFISTIRNTAAPIWVADPDILFIDDVKPLLDTDLARVRSIDGVEWAMPLFQRLTQARLASGLNQNIQLMGVDSETLIGLPQKVFEGNVLNLNTPDAVIVERKGLKKLGNPKIGDVFEINDQRARIVAILDIPSGFQSLPYVYTTYERATSYIPQQRKLLSFILAKAAPGLSDEEVTRRIRQQTRLGAFTDNDFRWVTINYFLKNTGIPINFGITVALGVLVGAAIAAQTFYTFTIENIRQFATLKAMGTSNQTLVFMILLQSLVVGLIGYGLGLGLMAAFGSSVPGNSELSFYTPPILLLIAFISVVGVCMFSSLFSIYTVVKVEPALVFRG